MSITMWLVMEEPGLSLAGLALLLPPPPTQVLLFVLSRPKHGDD